MRQTLLASEGTTGGIQLVSWAVLPFTLSGSEHWLVIFSLMRASSCSHLLPQQPSNYEPGCLCTGGATLSLYSDHTGVWSGPKPGLLLTSPSPAKLTLEFVILMHWSPAGSAKDKWHLADDAASFENYSEIFHDQEDEEEEICPVLLSTWQLLTSGYPNLVPEEKKRKNMHEHWFSAFGAKLMKQVFG